MIFSPATIKIAFVLPILVIDHDDDFARADIFDRFVHTAENLFVVLFFVT